MADAPISPSYTNIINLVTVAALDTDDNWKHSSTAASITIFFLIFGTGGGNQFSRTLCQHIY